MGTSIFPSNVTGVTVDTATSGALSGDGSSGNKLAVNVDGVTVTVNGSNQLEANGGAVITVVFSGTTPNRTASLQVVDGSDTITIAEVTY